MNLCTKVKGAIKSLTHLWTVEVRWGTKLYTHKARNATDAFEWADCYPADADVRIIDFKLPFAARLASRDGAWVRL